MLVILYRVEGGGDTWPGETPPAVILGKSTKVISANDWTWDLPPVVSPAAARRAERGRTMNGIETLLSLGRVGQPAFGSATESSNCPPRPPWRSNSELASRWTRSSSLSGC